MPKIITKYKLEPAFSNEMEYEVTIHTVVETKKSNVVDDEGYVISDRRPPKVETSTKYGISAISLPSKKPAKVIILEERDMTEAQAIAYVSSRNQTTYNEAKPIVEEEVRRPRPIRLSGEGSLTDNSSGKDGRPHNINLTKALNQDYTKPTRLPKAGEITWADGSNNSQDSGDVPFV